MKTIKLALAAALVMSVAAGTSAQSAPKKVVKVGNAAMAMNTKMVRDITSHFQEWMISPGSNGYIYPKMSWNFSPDRNYSLKGLKPRKFLQYEKQRFGINLGWTDNASAKTRREKTRWFFARPGSLRAPIKYGEKIAIGYGKSPSFIKYAKRDFGINLDWSKQPSYEWIILGGAEGQPVRTGKDRVVLFNTKHLEPMLYFERTVGGHIGWPDSQKWWDAAKDWAKDNGPDYAKKLAVKALLSQAGL